MRGQMTGLLVKKTGAGTSIGIIENSQKFLPRWTYIFYTHEFLFNKPQWKSQLLPTIYPVPILIALQPQFAPLHPNASMQNISSRRRQSAIATYSSMVRCVLATILLPPLSSCQEWVAPPSLADDTLVNTFLSEKRKSGGLSLIDQNTELVAEHPPRSGR